MKKIIVLSFLCSIYSYGQNINHFEDINTQVWQPFTTAFETLDDQLFKSIHSEDLIRVSGDSKSIKQLDEYINGYKRRWVNKTLKQSISFRFLERITGTNRASERGIYKLTINPNTDNEKSYYGKFHVILTKVNDTWKILVDYDSSEKYSINETSYKEAFAIDDYSRY